MWVVLLFTASIATLFWVMYMILGSDDEPHTLRKRPTTLERIDSMEQRVNILIWALDNKDKLLDEDVSFEGKCDVQALERRKRNATSTRRP